MISVWLESIRRDVRFGVRQCRKDPTPTLAALLSLALAIGACTAAFALINALVLRPLPVQNPENLVYMVNRVPEGAEDSEYFSYPMFEHLRGASPETLQLFAMAYQTKEEVAFDQSRSQAEWAYPHAISGDALTLLGVKAALGRLLTASDDQPGRPPVAVLSYEFWTRRFARDPAVLGRGITYRGTHLQIVGVAADGFRGVEPGFMTDVWVPITVVRLDQVSNPNSTWLRIWGRLQPGVGFDRARAVLQAASTTSGVIHQRVDVRSAAYGPSRVRERFEQPLWILGTVALLVLMIACANVACLLVARTAGRSHDMSLQVALGAGRSRLVQQVLVESGLLSIASCVLGAFFAALVSPAIVEMMSTSQVPLRLDLPLDWRMLAFVGFAGSLITVLFGLIPALRAVSTSPNATLQAVTGRHTAQNGVFRSFLAGQIAFGFVVLFVGGLFVMSFSRLIHTDPGFDSGNLAIVNVDANGLQQNPATALAVWQQLVGQLDEITGVEAVSASEFALFEGPQSRIDVRLPDGGEIIPSHYLRISPGFLETMRMPLRAGRDFTWRDVHPDATPVVIVNESFARRFFPGGAALGRRLSTPQGRHLEIIGVAQDARYRSLREAPPPTVYSPSILRRYAAIELRTRLDLDALRPVLRDELARAHPALRMIDLTFQSTLVANTLVQERMLALLAAFFSTVAVVLVAVGLYGVVSYNVAQRRREIGIRLAIGATSRSVVGLVVRDLGVLAFVGLVLGMTGAQAAARFVSSLLYDVKASDASSVVLPIASLLAVCALSAAHPALRATRVDPVAALRDG